MRSAVWAILIVLLRACCTAGTYYSVGTEQPADTSCNHDIAYGARASTSVASSGSVYLAAWTDMRVSFSYAVYAARIASDGTVLDPAGIYLSPCEYPAARPAVCWNGASFFVVYGLTSDDDVRRIMGVRIMPDGTILDTTPIEIARYSVNKVSVSWDGTNHVVAWETGTGNGDIYFVRVSGIGTVLDATPRAVSTRATQESGILSASTTGRTLMVWYDDRSYATNSFDIYGAMIDTAGNILTPADGLPICTTVTSQSPQGMCWAGTDFKIVWPETTVIKCSRVTSGGTVLDPGGGVVSTGTEKRGAARIAWNGTNCLVTWTQGTTPVTDIYGGRIDSSGTPLDANGFPIYVATGQQTTAFAGSLGTDYLAGWTDSSTGAMQQRLCALRISSDGSSLGSAFDVATAAPTQELAYVAFSGREYLACWMEWKGGKQYVNAAILDGLGASPSPGSAFQVAEVVSNAGTSYITYPMVVWNGESFVVSWIDGSVHRAMRISRNGTKLDPDGIVVADNAGVRIPCYPGFATDGSKCLIITQVGSYMRSIILARDGTIVSNQQLESADMTGAPTQMRAYWTGQVYITLKYPTSVKILDQTGVKTSEYTVPGSDAYWLAVGDTNALLVARGTDQILTRRLNLDGTLVDTTPNVIPCTLSGGYPYPCVSWDGKHYVVTFWVSRPHPSPSAAINCDFQAVRVTSANTTVDTTPIELTDTLWDEDLWLMQCPGPKGRILMTYTSLSGLPYNARRVKVRFFDDYMDVTSLSAIREMSSGAAVRMESQVVTAAFPEGGVGSFYIQDGYVGMRVDGNQAVSSCQLVSFQGTLSMADGEPSVKANWVNLPGGTGTIPDWLGMSLRSLGGTAPSSAYEPILDGEGAYNVGLLVKAWGEVKSAGSGFFYVDDGSGLQDGSGVIGVKVYGTVPGTAPHVGKFVVVYGISGAEWLGGHVVRVLRAKSVETM